MDEKQEKKLRKILQLEKQNGFQNDAVMGGLENLSEELVERKEVKKLLEGYGDKKPFARQEVVEEVENQLETDRESSESEGSELSVSDRIEAAAGIGEKRGQKFRELGIETVRDLLFHFPRKIEDRREVKQVSSLNSGDTCTIVGTVEGVSKLEPNYDVKLVKAALNDGTGTVYPIWFNQPWVRNQLNQEEEIAVYGEVKKDYGEVQIENPIWEPSDNQKKTRKLIPIYPASEDLSQKVIRWVIRKNLNNYLDTVEQYPTDESPRQQGLWNRRKALKRIHLPKRTEDFAKGRRSLAFSELFLFYVNLLGEKDGSVESTQELSLRKTELEKFRKSLPFSLTNDQEEVLRELVEDLEAPQPMSRLLQGDVGTGKTAVAAAAGYLVATAGNQVGMMAPTTVLAEQHYRNFENIFGDLSVQTELLTGDLEDSKKEKVLSELESGDIDLLVGTHALLEETVNFEKLGLVIIDEEQRFGVAQKENVGSGGKPVNKLVLSATPIPRTITATVYGGYEVSKLEEFPQGDKDVSTYWVSQSKRDDVYEYVKKELQNNNQGFIVLPLVEESEEQDLKSAVETRKGLAKNQLKRLDIGLLHGRMPPEEKSEALEKFKAQELDALVSTTVIEVGVDIPSANILVVEEADQFGLTQLHQLRGRIGRSGNKAYCFAIGSPSTEEGRKRLEAFRDISDGFELVERDLEIRGPGDLLSSAQHGFQNSFRACNFLKDYDIMEAARENAGTYLDTHNPGDGVKEVFREYFEGEPGEIADS